MALTPSISFYAQTARSYAMVFACVLGSTLALLHALEAEAGRRGAASRAMRRWLVYAGLVALGGYLNEMSLLVLAAHAVTVLLARYGRRGRAGFGRRSGARARCLVLPLVRSASGSTPPSAWIRPPDLTDLRVLVHDYFGADDRGRRCSCLCCAVAAVLPPLHRGGRASGPAWWRQRRRLAALGGGAAAGAARLRC